MPYCARCGNNVTDAELECSRCFADLTKDEAKTEQPPTQPVAQTPRKILRKQRAGIGRTGRYGGWPQVWDDLEGMKAPSRHVGAVTLYRMYSQSPVVQSFLNITKSLTTVTDAVARIEQLRKLRALGEAIRVGPSVLVKLLRANAISPETARPKGDLQLSSSESEGMRGLMRAGLIFKTAGAYYLTQLGSQTAQGAAKLESSESSQSVNEAISTARDALNMINQEIRKLREAQASE